MSKEVAGRFLECAFAEQGLERDRAHVENLLDKDFMYKVFHAHAQKVGLITTLALDVFIAGMPNLGIMVMYAHALRRYQLKMGIEKLSLSDLAQTIFASGFPDVEDMHGLWDEQKLRDRDPNIRTDNFLDTVGYVA